MSLAFQLSYGALWLAVILQGLFIIVLLHQLAKLRQAAESGKLSARTQLPIGSTAPDITSIDSERLPQNLRPLVHKAKVLLFLSIGCPTCSELLDSMVEGDGEQMPPVIVICHGGPVGCDKVDRSLKFAVPIIIDDAGNIGERYGISVSPTAVVLDANQRVRAYGHPKNCKEIRALFSESASVEVSEGTAHLQSETVVLN